jgi:hypothetical protein
MQRVGIIIDIEIAIFSIAALINLLDTVVEFPEN